MQRLAIRFGIDRHRADTYLAARPNDAHRYLAPIRYQDFLKHTTPKVYPEGG
jgi:hypothetical protein